MSDFVNTVDVIGDEALADSIIDRSITEIADNYATQIGRHAFLGCSQLIKVDFPMVLSIDDSAFCNCAKLTTVNFPLVTSIKSYAFEGCRAITTADFPLVTSIGSSAFYKCSALTTLILRSGNTCTLSSVYGLADTTVASGTGYIYVPRALVYTYKAATNWSTYAAQFRALEDYTVDGTITGELDSTKI